MEWAIIFSQIGAIQGCDLFGCGFRVDPQPPAEVTPAAPIPQPTTDPAAPAAAPILPPSTLTLSSAAAAADAPAPKPLRKFGPAKRPRDLVVAPRMSHKKHSVGGGGGGAKEVGGKARWSHPLRLRTSLPQRRSPVSGLAAGDCRPKVHRGRIPRCPQDKSWPRLPAPRAPPPTPSPSSTWRATMTRCPRSGAAGRPPRAVPRRAPPGHFFSGSQVVHYSRSKFLTTHVNFPHETKAI